MEKKQKNIIIGLVVIVVILAISSLLIINSSNKTKLPKDKKVEKEVSKKTKIALKNKATISINEPGDKKLMDDRKAKYGVDKGLDMVIKSDEKVIINDKTIDMGELEEREMIERGELVSSDLKSKDNKEFNEYGLYVVKKGDNLWDIHFRLLRELFEKKGISISRNADEPTRGGFSSGVGKILKFSEKMVRIYSLENDSLYLDINNIEPNGKVIIYKMKEIESLLRDMTVRDIDNVVFDGSNLWVES